MTEKDDYYSSSDEAPEEESLSSSKKAAQKILSMRREADARKKSELKTKRRIRDELLKSQSQAKKPLSKLLEEAREADLEAAQAKKEATPKETAQIVKKPRKRVFEIEKDGFKVKVIGSRGPRPVAPKESNLLSMREAFLNRRSRRE